MPKQRDATTQAVLTRLLEEHKLTGETLLYREAERQALSATGAPGVFRLAANPSPSESVVDVYGPGYVVQAEQLGAGLAFAESARPNWQETMELRAMRAGGGALPPSMEHVEVVVTLAEILAQGGLLYPVESVTVERAWYATLPEGGIEVREAR